MLLALALAAGACEPSHAGGNGDPDGGGVTTTSTGPAAGGSVPATTASVGVSAAPVSAAPPPPPALDFLDWVVTHCFVDELGPSDYTRAWINHAALTSDFLPPGAPVPAEADKVLPSRGSPEARALAARLRADWLATPTSHVVDCLFQVAPRSDGPPWQRKGGNLLKQRYVAYLPRQLFVDPAAVHAILLLVPGGNGGRSRYFLTEVPDRDIFYRGSGGLQTQLRTDRFLADNPGATEPIIVALDSPGREIVNGALEHLTKDAPEHIAHTFLPGRRLDELVLGADGISSGSRELLRILWDKPEALSVVGFTCMSCGAMRPSDELLRPGKPEQMLAWARALAARKEQGLFDVRFAIGSRDGQLPCNWEYRELFVQGGLLGDGAPVESNCDPARRKEEHRCDRLHDGFHIIGDQAHHYGLLKHSYEPQLRWLLAATDRVVKARLRESK